MPQGQLYIQFFFCEPTLFRKYQCYFNSGITQWHGTLTHS